MVLARYWDVTIFWVTGTKPDALFVKSPDRASNRVSSQLSIQTRKGIRAQCGGLIKRKLHYFEFCFVIQENMIFSLAPS